ncbi:hypothetical protein H4K36_00360 [Streptomyces sp. DHE7-1]|nr:hypothetical protein [Streptomyces sp. DHE7-1]
MAASADPALTRCCPPLSTSPAVHSGSTRHERSGRVRARARTRAVPPVPDQRRGRPWRPRTHNGLLEVQDGIATVHTGIHTADVDVTVTVTLHTDPEGAEWDDIVEVSLHSVSGELMVRGLMDDLDEELPVLSFDGPGDYRLRIHARGRDTAIDLAPDEVTEYYLIQVWPAPRTTPGCCARRTATAPPYEQADHQPRQRAPDAR